MEVTVGFIITNLFSDEFWAGCSICARYSYGEGGASPGFWFIVVLSYILAWFLAIFLTSCFQRIAWVVHDFLFTSGALLFLASVRSMGFRLTLAHVWLLLTLKLLPFCFGKPWSHSRWCNVLGLFCWTFLACSRKINRPLPWNQPQKRKHSIYWHDLQVTEVLYKKSVRI